MLMGTIEGTKKRIAREDRELGIIKRYKNGSILVRLDTEEGLY